MVSGERKQRIYRRAGLNCTQRREGEKHKGKTDKKGYDYIIMRRRNYVVFSKQVDKRISAYQQELIATHYAEVENMYQKMRGGRHDYRNHIQAMKAFAAVGDLAAICEYLEKLDCDLSTVDTVIKTGNKMMDAIIGSRISLAHAHNIPVRADADIPVTLTTSEIDLCVIIGNLFENAIEAIHPLKEAIRPPGGKSEKYMLRYLRKKTLYCPGYF